MDIVQFGHIDLGLHKFADAAMEVVSEVDI